MNIKSSLVEQSNYGFSLFCLDLDSDLADGTIFVIHNNIDMNKSALLYIKEALPS